MPGDVTHLKAAYLYNAENGFKYDGELYLGSVCPDSVNLNGHAPKEIRWPTHLRHSDLSVWLNNATEFYEKHKSVYSEGYLKGYILHIITDIVWDREFDPYVFAVLKKSGVPGERLKIERWGELDTYENSEQSLPWLTQTVLPAMKITKPINIGTVKAEDTAEFVKCTIKNEPKSIKNNLIIDGNFMESFFKKVLSEAKNVLK